MEKAAALGVLELDAFINGIKQDIDAVLNAITSDFSNGLVEGTVNKIQVIKPASCMVDAGLICLETDVFYWTSL